jgi:hypothetical protein
VIATDLYEADDLWSDTDSSAAVLTDPGRFWDGPELPRGAWARAKETVRERMR